MTTREALVMEAHQTLEKLCAALVEIRENPRACLPKSEMLNLQNGLNAVTRMEAKCSGVLFEMGAPATQAARALEAELHRVSEKIGYGEPRIASVSVNRSTPVHPDQP